MDKKLDIYVINLKRTPERLELMNHQLKEYLGLDFIRVDAIDAKNSALLPKEQLNMMEESRNNEEYWHRNCLTPAEIACKLSHAKALQMIADGSAPYGCVLEDDALISQHAKKFLQNANWIKKSWKLIKISTCYNFHEQLMSKVADLDEIYKLYRIYTNPLSAAGYIVSKKTAKILAQELKTNPCVSDVYLFDRYYKQIKKADLMQMNPAIVRYYYNESTMVHGTQMFKEREQKIDELILRDKNEIRKKYHKWWLRTKYMNITFE